jgi:hypothetical protein
MDEIRLLTATRAVAAGIATAGAMGTAVNEASLEAGRIYYTRVLGRRGEATPESARTVIRPVIHPVIHPNRTNIYFKKGKN